MKVLVGCDDDLKNFLTAMDALALIERLR